MFIIKIGGSVITDKSKENTFKKKIIDNLGKQIKKSKKEIILVHGAGSFGHILAKKYNLNEGYKNQIHGFSLTHALVQKLNLLVLNSLHENGIPAVSLPPHNILKLKNHKFSSFNDSIFNDYLKIGFTPVTFGDVVLDETLGFSICSGDLLMQILSYYFKPEKAIFIIDEDGLFTSNPKINKNAEFISSATIEKLKKLTVSADKHDDVTGGMAGKIETIKNIAKLGIDTILLNGNKPDRLFNVLVGKNTKSTIIYGVKK
ncbi:MAG: isopentenyl phosphate kinase [Thermoplasmatota archaeon]